MKHDQKLDALTDLLLAIADYAGQGKDASTMAAQSVESQCYPTQVDLQRLTPYKREDVKKLLRQLGQWHLVYPVGINPKRYRFDEWHCRALMENPQNFDIDDTLASVLSRLENRHDQTA